MKNLFTAAMLLSLAFTKIFAQSDTLHIYYQGLATKILDSNETKIGKWAKSLNGKKVDVQVLAYYNDKEFKKYSQERVDELFLVLNRKARELITITFSGPVKGQRSQRSKVDIVYIPQGQKPAVTPPAEKSSKPDVVKTTEKKEEKKKEEKKEEKKKDEVVKTPDEKKKSKSEIAEEQLEKNDKKDKSVDKDKKKEKKGDDEEDDEDYGQASSRTISEGGNMTLEEVNYIRSAKLIVAQTGKKSMDDKLYNAVKDYWDFTSNVVQMPYDEARKLGKENKKDTIVIFSFIQVKTWFTEKRGPLTVKILRIGYALAIETGKGKLLYKQFIRKDKGQEPPVTYYAFGVAYLNDVCRVMYEHNLSKAGKADEYFDLRTPELKNKTLYIADYQLNPKLPREDVPTYYSSPVKLVSDQVWEDAILKKKDVAYVMVVLVPNNPKHFYHYIMDAKTGKVYLVDTYAKFRVSLGMGAPDFSPTQSGFVDKANLQSYEKGINKAMEDNKERADDKVNNAEKEKAKAEAKEKKEQDKKAKEKQKEEEKKAKEEAKKNK